MLELIEEQRQRQLGEEEERKEDNKRDEFRNRVLSKIELERLQTVPENYTASVANTQRFNLLGNGWTVDAVAHIFKGLKLDQAPKKFFKTTLF